MSDLDRWTRTRQQLLEKVGARRLLAEASAGDGWRVDDLIDFEPIKERPGRRLIVRCRVVAARRGEVPGELTWWAKLQRSRRGARLHHRLQRLAAALPPGVRLPEPVGYSAKRRLLVLGGLEGRSLREILREGSATEAVHALSQVGRAIRALHGMHITAPWVEKDPGMEWTSHGAGREAAVLVAANERTRGSGLPASLRDRHERWAGRALQHLLAPEDPHPSDPRDGDPSPTQGSILHRDLHPAQIVLGESGVGLLDLDDMARGEPELDVGNLLAHLTLEDLQTRGEVARAAGWQATLLGAYGWQSGVGERLAVYHAASLLRLASLQRLAEPEVSVLDWRQLAEKLVTEAAGILSACVGAEAESDAGSEAGL